MVIAKDSSTVESILARRYISGEKIVMSSRIQRIHMMSAISPQSDSLRVLLLGMESHSSKGGIPVGNLGDLYPEPRGHKRRGDGFGVWPHSKKPHLPLTQATSYGKKENLRRKNTTTENNISVLSFQFSTLDVHCGKRMPSHQYTIIRLPKILYSVNYNRLYSTSKSQSRHCHSRDRYSRTLNTAQ